MSFNERNALLMRLEQLAEHEKNLVEQLRRERETIFTRLQEIDQLDFYCMKEQTTLEKRDVPVYKSNYLN